MTKDEFNRIVGETKVSTLCSYSDDPLRDLLAEIYFEGFKDGFTHLKGIVDRVASRYASMLVENESPETLDFRAF